MVKLLKSRLFRIPLIVFILACIVLPSVPLFQVSVSAAPSDRYWAPSGGVASGNWNDTNHWSYTDDGTGGDPVPDTETNVYFTANAGFGVADKTVTINQNYTQICHDMDWTGAANNPIINFNAGGGGNPSLYVTGSLKLISGMTAVVGAGTAWLSFQSTSAGETIDTAGIVLPTITDFNGVGGEWTLTGNLNLNSGLIEPSLRLTKGSVNTNGYTVTLTNGITSSNANTRSLILGSSVLNITDSPGWVGAWEISPATNMSLDMGSATINATGDFFTMSGVFTAFTAGTSVIKLTGTIPFNGGGFTYHELQLNGTAHTISGSNTFNDLITPSGTTQTLTFTDGTNQTVTNATLSGDATHTHTLQGTGAAGWTITKAGGGLVNNNFVNVSWSTGSPDTTWYYSALNSTVANTTQWYDSDHTPLLTTDAATGITMNKDGVTGGSFNGTITDLGGYPSVTGWFEYGLAAPAYGSVTANQVGLPLGAFTASVPINLTPGQTYHYRANASNALGTTNGADQSFTFTMPTHTSQAATAISMDKDGVTSGNFVGNISNFGVASSTYVAFDYGLTGLYGTTTLYSTVFGIGDFSIPIPNNLTPGQTYHFRAKLKNGAVINNGADKTFTLTMPTVTTGTIPTPTLLTTTLNGNLTNMGKASDTYVSFEWGYDGVTYGHTSSSSTKGATGTYTLNISGYIYDTTVHYRAVATNGAVKAYGSDKTFAISAAAVRGFNFIDATWLLVFVIVGLYIILKVFAMTESIVAVMILISLLAIFAGVINTGIKGILG